MQYGLQRGMTVGNLVRGAAPEPKPATKFLPKWWREAKGISDSEGRPMSLSDKPSGSEYAAGASAADFNLTFKRCVPFMEAMSIGYILPLHFDLIIDQKEDGNYEWVSRADEQLGMSSPNQIKEIPEWPDHTTLGLRINNPWAVRTEPGVSCLFIQPMNRPDLELQVFSGVVDTDKYTIPVNFPFSIKKTDGPSSRIIEIGTPLAQIIPFRREDCKSKTFDLDSKTEKSMNKEFGGIMSRVQNYYRSLYSRKEYK